MNKQGQHLQEVGVSFIVKNKITIEDAKKFLSKLVDVLEVEQVNVFEHSLPPGFDVSVNINESIIYFGFWGETNYVRLFCSSCKQFDDVKVVDLVKSFFKERVGKVRVTIISDTTIKDEVEDLCLDRY